MAREIAAVERMDEASAVAKIDDVLAKTARHFWSLERDPCPGPHHATVRRVRKISA